MNCPVCPESQLQMTERQGVEIDYCPNCRGVWLDRGELDKIIDRASGEVQQAAPPPPPPQPQAGYAAGQQGQPQGYGNQQQYGRKPDDSDYKFRYPQQGGHYKKKKSILSDIFDF